MTNDVLKVLENNLNKRLLVSFIDGAVVECMFYGFSYDYDELGNEILELDFERLSDKALFGTTPGEIESVNVV